MAEFYTAISPLFLDRFGRSFRFDHLEFDNEAISDFELSFCGPFFILMKRKLIRRFSSLCSKPFEILSAK